MSNTSIPNEPVMMTGRPIGTQIRSVAAYAAGVAVMLAWPPLFIFLPAALVRCGLRNGRRAAWIALAIGAAVAALAVIPLAQGPQARPAEWNLGVAYLLGILLAVAIPSLLVIPLVERAEPFGRVLMVAILAAIVGLAVTELSMRAVTHYSPYEQELAGSRDAAGKVIAAYEKAGMPADMVRVMRKSMDVVGYCLPGLIVVEVISVFLVSFLLFGRSRPWRERLAAQQAAVNPYLFRNLSLPDWLLFVFVLAGLSPLASGLVRHAGANLLAVVVFLYLLQGFAVFRAIVASTGPGFGAAFFAWGLLVFLTLTGFAPLLLSIAGLFDSFFDFRHFNRKDHSDESHSH
jgi:uncharacterized protein YybS (DUF2232 family)